MLRIEPVVANRHPLLQIETSTAPNQTLCSGSNPLLRTATQCSESLTSAANCYLLLRIGIHCSKSKPGLLQIKLFAPVPTLCFESPPNTPNRQPSKSNSANCDPYAATLIATFCCKSPPIAAANHHLRRWRHEMAIERNEWRAWCICCETALTTT